MPLGFQTDARGRPGGTAENSPAFQRSFQRWVWTPEGLSPEGRADSAPIQPSLSGLGTTNVFPSVETLVITHISFILRLSFLIPHTSTSDAASRASSSASLASRHACGPENLPDVPWPPARCNCSSHPWVDRTSSPKW